MSDFSIVVFKGMTAFGFEKGKELRMGRLVDFILAVR
jgi:hypothetical protein